jgi:ATP-grasp domain
MNTVSKMNQSAESFIHPKILLASTGPWALGSRVAIGLSRVGCEVSALCASNDPLRKTKAVEQTFPYSGLRPLRSLSVAIEISRPQILVPCDDRAVQHLHELHKATPSDAVAALIERSLGHPDSYPIAAGRYSLLKVAREKGLRVADTSIITSADDFSAWCDREPFPWVLKADHTFGGYGVRIASNVAQAQRYFSELRRLFTGKNALRHLIIDDDTFWLRPWLKRREPTVIIQRFIPGTPANCAAVCWKGRILASICVKVLRTHGPNQSATIVRVVNNREMTVAAEMIAGRLRLSGFFGLDFILDNRTGEPYLIEMNPRCTPPCHLALGHGRDLVGALSAELSGQEMRVLPAVTNNDLIAYFPGARYSGIELLESCFYDIPQGEALLVQKLLQDSSRRSLLRRAMRYLRSKTRSTRGVAAPKPETGGVEQVSSAIYLKPLDCHDESFSPHVMQNSCREDKIPAYGAFASRNLVCFGPDGNRADYQ